MPTTSTYPCPCDINRSPVFVLDNPQEQTAANNVYVFKKAYDAAQAAKGSKAVYTFKTDRERMQYLAGLYGRTSQGLA